jgi:hypothetical protein
MADASRFEEIEPRQGAVLPAAGTRPAHAARARLGGASPLAAGVGLGACLLIVVALAKPWGTPAEPSDPGPTSFGQGVGPGTGLAAFAGPTASGSMGASQAGASAMPGTTPLPRDSVGCGAPDGWRLVTVAGFLGQPTVSSSAVGPITAGPGPDDPAIPAVPVGQGPIAAVGICRPSPTSGDAGEQAALPAPRIVGAWRLDQGGPLPLAIVPRGAAAVSSEVAQLYAPGPSPGTGWVAGRYVVEVATADLPLASWLGFSVDPGPPAERSTQPSAGPSSSP